MTSYPMVLVALFADVSLARLTANNSAHAFLRSISRQNRQAAWGKTIWKSFMMAISPEKAALTPKPATGLGKIDMETVYHGDREETRDRIGETVRIDETIRISKAARTRPTQNSKPPSFPPDFPGNDAV